MPYDVYLIEEPTPPRKFKRVVARQQFYTLDEANKWVAKLETANEVKIVDSETREVVWSSKVPYVFVLKHKVRRTK